MPSVRLDPTRQSSKDIDFALRKLKKKVEAAGTLKKLQEKEFFEPKSDKRKRKKAAAKLRQKRLTASEKQPEKMF